MLLRAERRARGTPTGRRALTCWNQALLVLTWCRNHGEIALVGAEFWVSRATAYRYRDEVVDVLADQLRTCTTPWRRWPSRGKGWWRR